MKKKLRVLVLMHEDLVPPDDPSTMTEEELLDVKTEQDVVQGLRDLGHEILKLGVRDELAPLRSAIQDWKPDIVFNLLEEFHGQPMYDQNVVGYLELMRTPYTGCNPRGLVLARDKALSKKILQYHRIRVPRFAVVPLGRKLRRPKVLDFPLIVKSLVEEASLGISQASVVRSDDKLAERIRFIHTKVKTDCIVEQYIDGRELYVAMYGNHRLTVLPTWELLFENPPADAVRIATRNVKWDPDLQKRWDIAIDVAHDLPDDTVRRIERVSKRIYRLLGLTGYARIDFRLASSGEPFFLEANPNPEISRDGEFASAAESAGMTYPQLLDRLIRIGLQRAEARQ